VSTGLGCLGTGEYGARVIARRTPTTGRSPVGDLTLVSGAWGRRLNSTSTAQVIADTADAECSDILRKINPLRHELELFRDDDMVWCGPITAVQQDGTIDAQDLSVWFTLRLFLHTVKPGYRLATQPKTDPHPLLDLARIFEGYANYALGRGLPEWGVFFHGDDKKPTDPPLPSDDPGLELVVTECGVKGKRTVYKGDLKIVMGELEELAQTGCDWTVALRKMLVGGVEITDPEQGGAITFPGRITDEDFTSAPRIRRTSEGMASGVWTRGNGARGQSGYAYDDGVEVHRVLDEYSIEDDESAAFAAEGFAARGAEPLTYVEGEGHLDQSVGIDIQHLVPGARVRVVLDGGGTMDVGTVLRLESIDVTFGAEGENVRPTLQPLGLKGDARGAGG
jgi:hypothetical protein